MKLFLAITALLMASLSWAQTSTRSRLEVTAVQMPAWVQHGGGIRQPLTLNSVLANSDRIYTGANARVLLRLEDASLIKLGENAVLALDEIERPKSAIARTVVTAALDVVSGAFRFTSQTLARSRPERDVRVRIATLTVGIRGTDVWGKQEPTRDVVCLIQGQITVTRTGDTITMDQPKSFYIAPRDLPPLPVAPVSQQQLDQWSLETEIVAGAGVIRRGGTWKVDLGRFDSQEPALALYDQVNAAGYAAQIRPVKLAQGRAYRVQITQLASKADAEAVASTLESQVAGAQPRVTK